MIGDVEDIEKRSKGLKNGKVLGKNEKELKKYNREKMRKNEGGYLIRIKVNERIGDFEEIERRMEEKEI